MAGSRETKLRIIKLALTLALCTIFTALHVMQTRYSDENSVHLSVRLSVWLSVTRVNCDKMEERSVQIFIPYER